LIESDIPKGVFKSRIIRDKLTEKEKRRHNRADRKYKQRVRKERRKKGRGLFGLWGK